MSYRVEFEGAALIELNGLNGLNGLPKQAFEALVERVVEAVDAPWDASVMPPGDDPAYRPTVFGEGHGLLLFRVDDATELIRISRIVWIGRPREPSQPKRALPVPSAAEIPSVSISHRLRSPR